MTIIHLGSRKTRHPKDPEGRMTLREHVAELRNRLFIAVLAIVLGSIAGWFFYNQTFHFLTAPFTSVTGVPHAPGQQPILSLQGVGDPLTFRMKAAGLFGVVVSSPVWLYQFWAFVAPGLHRNEKKWTILFASIAAPLFVGGMAVAYWTLPKGIRILFSFTPGGVRNIVPLPAYLDFVIRTMLVFGIAFLIPLVVVLLNLLGVVSGALLGKFRPYIIVAIFIFAAMATPSGDPFTMCLLAIPMSALFLSAELIARMNDKRRARIAEQLEA